MTAPPSEPYITSVKYTLLSRPGQCPLCIPTRKSKLATGETFLHTAAFRDIVNPTGNKTNITEILNPKDICSPPLTPLRYYYRNSGRICQRSRKLSHRLSPNQPMITSQTLQNAICFHQQMQNTLPDAHMESKHKLRRRCATSVAYCFCTGARAKNGGIL